MVGGGNYIEYQNLMDFVQTKSPNAGGGSHGTNKRIIYGCSTLTNSNQMMQQLAELGHEMWYLPHPRRGREREREKEMDSKDDRKRNVLKKEESRKLWLRPREIYLKKVGCNYLMPQMPFFGFPQISIHGFIGVPEESVVLRRVHTPLNLSASLKTIYFEFSTSWKSVYAWMGLISNVTYIILLELKKVLRFLPTFLLWIFLFNEIYLKLFVYLYVFSQI